MTKRGALALLFFFALLASGANARAAPGDPVAGKRKTVTCNACHGNSGFKSMPRLGGQSAAYVVEALRAFKEGRRPHSTMRDVAGALSERDMADLGAHYASLPRAAASEEAPPPASAASCAACHGVQGADPATPDVAILAGQSAGYLELALREYRSGTRAHTIMQAVARGIEDAQIAELAAWFSSRPGLTAK
jgi:cytochrome c553